MKFADSIFKNSNEFQEGKHHGRRNLKSSIEIYDFVKNSIEHGVNKIKKEAKVIKKLVKKVAKKINNKMHPDQ